MAVDAADLRPPMGRTESETDVRIPARPASGRSLHIFVLGPPGAGKGTLCRRVSLEYGWCHISVGEYRRELCASNSAATLETLERLYKVCDCRGPLELRNRLQCYDVLLSPEILAAIVQDKLRQEQRLGYDRFLLDGFPREASTAKLFELQMGAPKLVLVFDCPKTLAKDRFIARRRGDDDDQTFETRYEQWVGPTAAVCRMYGGTIVKLDTSGNQEESYRKLVGLIS